MNKTILGASLGALLLAGGVAYAETAPGGLLNHDMTRAQAQAKATEAFARLDVNQDGKLDQADRAARLGQQFDRADADHNGQISRPEFLAMHERGPDQGRDKDGPGKGFGHGHGRGHGGPRGMGGMMGLARTADANHDGAVSKAEFTAAALARFDQADTDKNGTVTGAERQAARKAMRANWRDARQAAPATSSAPTPGAT